MSTTLAQVAWSGVVLDEAQNIKNPESKQARAARTIKSAYRIALTGTPVENHVGDLWSLMEFLNPGPARQSHGIQTPLPGADSGLQRPGGRAAA